MKGGEKGKYAKPQTEIGSGRIEDNSLANASSAIVDIVGDRPNEATMACYMYKYNRR